MPCAPSATAPLGARRTTPSALGIAGKVRCAISARSGDRPEIAAEFVTAWKRDRCGAGDRMRKCMASICPAAQRDCRCRGFSHGMVSGSGLVSAGKSCHRQATRANTRASGFVQSPHVDRPQ